MDFESGGWDHEKRTIFDEWGKTANEAVKPKVRSNGFSRIVDG
jgi:hypothetical protein